MACPSRISASGCFWIPARSPRCSSGWKQAELIKRTRSTEDERQVLIALTPQGQALREKARAVPQAILAASACSVAELLAMKNEMVALRDRLNAAVGE